MHEMERGTGPQGKLLGLAMVASWDHEFLAQSLASFASLDQPGSPSNRHVLISRVGWDGLPSNWRLVEKIVRAANANPILGTWASEEAHRRAALEHMRASGYKYALIADTDEVASGELLGNLKQVAEDGLWEIVHCRLATYFLSPTLRVVPDEELAPIIMIDCQKIDHFKIREYRARPGEKARTLRLEPGHGPLYHLSWAGSPRRLDRKVSSSSHAPEFVPGWKADVLEAFIRDHSLHALHPTNPWCYHHCEREALPPELRGVRDLYPVPRDPPVPEDWPRISLIISLYGGEDDIRACLRSIRRIGLAPRSKRKRGKGLLFEVIVVDDASPDGAKEVVRREFPWVKLIENEQNLGFPGANNRGLEVSTGEVVVFLNSDTQMTRAGLIRLIETLMSSGTVGAAGPYTNNAGYSQRTDPCYRDPVQLEAFCRDFAASDREDREVSMVVGLCYAVKRRVLDEVGCWDTRFGRGLFEDNDLCTRILAARYRLLISGRSYIHHEGGKSLARCAEHPHAGLKRNQRIFEEKWRDHLLTGHFSHLAGQEEAPIRIDPHREPGKVWKRIAKLAKMAQISVCMIVRDEEKNLGACLESIKRLAWQIVIVDTGSKDGTVEIAKRYTKEVYEIEWPDSFAAARNVSLKYAKGKWVLWVDADDTIELSSIEAILQAAIYAPPRVSGFLIPVRFVEEGPNAGTQVDHCKMFRRKPAKAFDGRIHEQVLESVRNQGDVVRLPGAVVLHTGYDTSPEGQSKKRARDRYHLRLDLRDHPNHPYRLFNLGMTAYYLGRFPVAIGWMKRCIRHSHEENSTLRKAYAFLGGSHAALGRHERALEVFARGLAAVGEDPELHYRSGESLAPLGRLEEARAEYLKIDPDTSGFISSIDIGILTFKRLNKVAAVCEAMDRHAEAVGYWREAIKANPHYALTPVTMFDACMARRDFVLAEEAAEGLLPPTGPSRHWAERRAALAEAKGLDVDRELVGCMTRFPMATAAGMLLANRMIQRGQEEAALPLLEHLDNWGCAEAAFYRGIHAARQGDFKTALYHTRRCLDLDPGNEQALRQIEALEKAIAAKTP